MVTKKKILVTGGGGFIGKALVNKLVSLGNDVCSLTRSNYKDLDKIGLKQFIGDISEKEFVGAACEDIEVVFHIAAKVGLWGKYEEFFQTNVIGTQNIINACISRGVKYLVFTSSASVVFNDQNIENGNEELSYPEKILSNYAFTKSLAEKKVLEANCSKLKTISLRPHLVWGPGDTHLIPGILKRSDGGSLRQIGNNTRLIDTTYIENYTHAQIQAINAMINGNKACGKAFFVTNGEPVKVWDFINEILLTYGRNPVNRTINYNVAYSLATLSEVFYRYFLPKKEPRLTRFTIKELCKSHWFDISRAREYLGYTPVVSTKEGFNKLKLLAELNR